ncbi:MAG TPA: sugar phosphate isomerase/epimerase [Rhodoglobus sp.]|nr:sugar phosphate isomerase/epimerase [Rhodoglobus sp.]
MRNALEHDIPGTIEKVREIGFSQVEASYKVLSRGPELLEAIRANGLVAPTMTSSLMDVDREHVFAIAEELGAGAVIDTFIPEEHWTTAQDVARIAEELNVAADAARAHGLRVGYHNHWWELERRFDGRTAFDLLISELDPGVVLEVDAYWVAVGGEDPVAFVERHADRVRFLHLKDGPIDRVNTSQVPAGRGSMPVFDVLDAATSLEVGVIEFDDYDGDVFDGIAAAFATLSERVGV